MTNQIQLVSFHNQQITVLNYNNKPYVAMKSVVENIGLDWHAQLNRINRHHVLSKGVVMIATPTKGGMQSLACLPISMLNGWLFGIDTNRVKPEIRSTLEQYQLECFDVLYNHFMPKLAQQYPNTINEEQQYLIRKAVDERVYRTGEHHQSVYHKLYDQFKIPSYKDLPVSKFNQAIEFLGGVKITHNKLPLTESNLVALLNQTLWVANFYIDNGLTKAFKMMGSDYGYRMHDHISSCHSLAMGLKRELERYQNKTSIQQTVNY